MNDFINDFDFENRIVETSYTEEDVDTEITLRPDSFEEYIGQEKAKEVLKIYIDAAKMRGDTLDHVLLYGPPGLGKTTLSGIIAEELGVNFRVTSGPAIEKQGDLAALLTNLGRGDVLFIDEIHRLNRNIEEILYPAMEDMALDIIIGKGPAARSIRLPLQHFTLIGATTRAGQLTTPLRDRFGVILRLELYTPEELSLIVKRSAGILGVPIDDEGALEIASRSRGTPRIDSIIESNGHSKRFPVFIVLTTHTGNGIPGNTHFIGVGSALIFRKVGLSRRFGCNCRLRGR